MLVLTLYDWLCVSFTGDVSLPQCFLVSFMLLTYVALGAPHCCLHTHRPVLSSRLFSERELVALLLWIFAGRLAAVGLLCCTGAHTYNTCGGFPGPREMGLLLVNVPVCGVRTLDV